MKKTSLFSLLLVVFLSVNVLSSCGGGGDSGGSTPVGDTTKPVITNLKPVNGTTFLFGSQIVVTADAADNEELASYKINIHDNFDNHGAHTVSTKGATAEVPFSATAEGKLSGKTAKISHTFELTVLAADKKSKYQAGEYHVVVTVLDKAGNEAVVYSGIILADN